MNGLSYLGTDTSGMYDITCPSGQLLYQVHSSSISMLDHLQSIDYYMLEYIQNGSTTRTTP